MKATVIIEIETDGTLPKLSRKEIWQEMIDGCEYLGKDVIQVGVVTVQPISR